MDFFVFCRSDEEIEAEAKNEGQEIRSIMYFYLKMSIIDYKSGKKRVNNDALIIFGLILLLFFQHPIRRHPNAFFQCRKQARRRAIRVW